MAVNTLFRTGEESPLLHRGHGTEALGPSDSSDSGSDVHGVLNAADAAELGLDSTWVDDSLLRGQALRSNYVEAAEPSLDETVINYPKK